MDRPNIFRQLGVEPIINAAGTFTSLGGSLMPEEVVHTWVEASRHFIDLQELQVAVGQRIADLLDVEAALVTGGAASGIVLGTAAAISLKHPAYVDTHFVSDRPLEVLRQASHRDVYDRQLESCGVRLVDVTTAHDVKKAINDRTVLMMAYNVYMHEGELDHSQWLQLARDHKIPTLLDAAADIPPVSNLTRWVNRGYDMVVFSGGKAVRGPQSSGILLGKDVFITAARNNAVPIEGTVGRAAKVSKEDIVALWRALEIFVRSGDAIIRQCDHKVDLMASILADTPQVTVKKVTPPVANPFPHLVVQWNQSEIPLTEAEIARQLLSGNPRIATGRVYGITEPGLVVSPINLQSGQDLAVAHRIAQIITEAAQSGSE